jgi:hypothetical protein
MRQLSETHPPPSATAWKPNGDLRVEFSQRGWMQFRKPSTKRYREQRKALCGPLRGHVAAGRCRSGRMFARSICRRNELE